MICLLALVLSWIHQINVYIPQSEWDDQATAEQLVFLKNSRPLKFSDNTKIDEKKCYTFQTKFFSGFIDLVKSI